MARVDNFSVIDIELYFSFVDIFPIDSGCVTSDYPGCKAKSEIGRWGWNSKLQSSDLSSSCSISQPRLLTNIHICMARINTRNTSLVMCGPFSCYALYLEQQQFQSQLSICLQLLNWFIRFWHKLVKNVWFMISKYWNNSLCKNWYNFCILFCNYFSFLGKAKVSFKVGKFVAFYHEVLLQTSPIFLKCICYYCHNKVGAYCPNCAQ